MSFALSSEIIARARHFITFVFFFAPLLLLLLCTNNARVRWEMPETIQHSGTSSFICALADWQAACWWRALPCNCFITHINVFHFAFIQFMVCHFIYILLRKSALQVPQSSSIVLFSSAGRPRNRCECESKRTCSKASFVRMALTPSALASLPPTTTPIHVWFTNSNFHSSFRYRSFIFSFSFLNGELHYSLI